MVELILAICSRTTALETRTELLPLIGGGRRVPSFLWRSFGVRGRAQALVAGPRK